MLKHFLLFLTTASLLAGCSSHNVDLSQSYEHPYCYTDEKIQLQNGTKVNSNTTVQCTDKPRIEHVVKDEAVASDCRMSRPLIGNRNPQNYGSTLLCRFTDPMGREIWRPVNEAFAYPTFN